MEEPGETTTKNPGRSPSRVNANPQLFLGQTSRPAPVSRDLQAFPNNESKNDLLPTHLSTDRGLSEQQAKVASRGEESIAANAHFEILQYHFSPLRKELEEYYREDPAGVFDDGIMERLEGIAAAIRSNPVGPVVSNGNSPVTLGKPREARPTRSVSFTNIPQWREHLSTEKSPVKAEKAKLSVFFSKLIHYTNFLKFLNRDERASQSRLQSAGSNTESTSPNNPLKPPFKKSDNTDNQQVPGGYDAIITLRKLARTALRQNNLIFSKLNRRQQPVVLNSTSSRSHPPSVSHPVPPKETPTIKNFPLIILYTANIVFFLTLLVAIA